MATEGTDIAEQDPEIAQHIAVRISVLARLIRSDFDRRLSETNITRSQLSLLAVVQRRPGATQRAIAEILDMSEASAGRLIDRLCADGLLDRRERDDDRRARAVYVTDAAQPLLSQAADLARANSERIFDGLSERQLEELQQSLEVIYENLARNSPWARRLTDPSLR